MISKIYQVSVIDMGKMACVPECETKLPKLFNTRIIYVKLYAESKQMYVFTNVKQNYLNYLTLE